MADGLTVQGDQPEVAITLPQNVWQRLEYLVGVHLADDADDVDLIRVFWALRGEEDDQTHVSYKDGTCSDGCVALHPAHASTRGEE